MSSRETTTPVAARLTSATVAEVDQLAAELRMTRGSVVTLLIAVALRNPDIFATFRELHTARSKGA